MNLIVLFLALVLPPEATEIPHEITAHGQTRVDDFYWMNNIEDPAVLEYLQAENEYTDSLMAGSSELIETIAVEIIERMRTDEASVPYYRNGYWYWYEYLPEQDYAVNMRRAHPDGEPEILLNENIYSESHDYFSIETISVSPDNRTVAWAYDTTGGHWNTLVFQDISSGDTLDIITGCAGSVAWASDSRMVFFGLKDETGRTDRIMRKTIGCDDMTMVYFEEDPTFWPWVSNSQDREWILIGSASSLETEYRIVPASDPVDSLLLIHPRTDDLEYYVYPFGSTLYINTNLDGENFSIMRVSADSPGIGNWETVVPHDPSALITDLDIFDDILAVSMLSEGQKKDKEEEIVAKEKQAYELKHKYFGPKGELFKKREELMKPIRQEVWKSLKKLAMKRGYQIIMDKETSKIVYADPTVDLSKQVLSELGFE